MWDGPWDAGTIIDRCTVWFPPPEMARQCISLALEAYIERPLTTSALFVVPRVVQAFWWGLSKCLHELPTIFPHKTPLRIPPRVPIPVIVLYLPPHERVLPPLSNRLERIPRSRAERWHLDQAAFVRRLPPTQLGT